QYFHHNRGIAPYFRTEVKKWALKILEEMKNPEGMEYNIYTDGLKIHTTLDSRMHALAEKAMREHMAKLQAQFEKAYGKNAPWLANEKILEEAIKNAPRFRELKKKGLENNRIMDSMKLKKEMEFFYWGKDSVVTASSIDSLQHYLRFLNIGFIA